MNGAARIVVASVLGSVTSGALGVEASTHYPSRPIRFIAPFVPGGPSDILSRMLGHKLGESWNQSVVVDNRGSAGGIVGFELGAKAPPDGYTLTLATSSGVTVNPHVYLKLPYAAADFQPITQITSGPSLMVVHPGVAAKTIPEFIALAKAKPGQLTFATTGTNNLLAAEAFKYMAGVNLLAVPYKGTGQAVNAVLGGEVNMFVINLLAGVPQLKAGKVRALGISSRTRNPALPDVPPIADSVPGFEQITWHSVLVPAKTPKPIVEKLNAELVRIIKSHDISERIRSQGLDPVGSSVAELEALIQRESAENAKLIKQIGLKPQSY